MPSPRPFARFRIGSVVAVSLVIGLVTGVTLALVPFGGAQENVIAAVVLHAFGLGWALRRAIGLPLELRLPAARPIGMSNSRSGALRATHAAYETSGPRPQCSWIKPGRSGLSAVAL